MQRTIVRILSASQLSSPTSPHSASLLRDILKTKDVGRFSIRTVLVWAFPSADHDRHDTGLWTSVDRGLYVQIQVSCSKINCFHSTTILEAQYMPSCLNIGKGGDTDGIWFTISRDVPWHYRAGIRADFERVNIIQIEQLPSSILR